MLASIRENPNSSNLLFCTLTGPRILSLINTRCQSGKDHLIVSSITFKLCVSNLRWWRGILQQLGINQVFRVAYNLFVQLCFSFLQPNIYVSWSAAVNYKNEDSIQGNICQFTLMLIMKYG